MGADMKHDAALLALPDGVVFEKQSAFHTVIVRKAGSQLQLVFGNPHGRVVQSRLVIGRPLQAVPPYLQAALLGLVWAAKPRRAYILGLGGGRLALILRQGVTECVVEATEVDEVVFQVVQDYFGVRVDEHLQVHVQDGREYLEKVREPYDFIFIDAFSGTGVAPRHLRTSEFFELCRRRLRPQGVVILHMYQGQRFAQYAETFRRSFRWAAVVDLHANHALLFGWSGSNFQISDVVERVRELDEQFQLAFSLVPFAKEFRLLEPREDIPPFQDSEVK